MTEEFAHLEHRICFINFQSKNTEMENKVQYFYFALGWLQTKSLSS